MALDASKNFIKVIQHNCFKTKVDLRVIILNNNMLQHIQKFAFHQLISLLSIDLSNNMLTLIPKYFVILSQNLSYLSLKNNPLNSKFTKDITISFNVKYFSTSHFSLCCFASKNTRCSVTKSWYMSCSHILLNLPIKFAFYFVTTVILVINILSIYLVIKYERGIDKIKSDTTGAFNTIFTSINIVDIIGSIPLFILWANDLYFKNDFVLIRDQWSSSILCFISCGISIHFILAAPFLHMLLSYVRYMVVKNPFDRKFKSKKFIYQTISVGYSFSCIFAILITTLFWLINGSIPTIYCSAFLDPSKTFSLTKALTFVIISINILAFLSNLIAHINLVMTTSSSQRKHIRTNSKMSQSKTLIVQIICITCSHLLCWIPDIIIYLFVYFMDKYPMEMILWKLVCISPLNSILIPIIFVMKRLIS